MVKEITSFISTVRKGGASMVITIEKNVVAFEGLKEGDRVKILIKKLKR